MRSPSRTRLTGAALFGAALAGPLAAQQPARPTTTLSGNVSNLNGIPLGRAEVLIVGTDLRTFASDSGVYEFYAVPVGRIKVVARRIGFEPNERRATLEVGKHKQVDFELKGLPELLDSVMVRESGGNGRMSDFWARRLVGVGAFLTHDEIERRRPMRSSDLLRTVTGVTVVQGESGFDKPVIMMGRTTVLTRGGRAGQPQLANECKVSYYVDGSWVPPGTFHMDDLSPLMLEAVEVYRGPSEIPVRFRQRETACGVIALWTREPPAKQAQRPPGGA
jgi:outer membrane receptor protein involved in Fe transport